MEVVALPLTGTKRKNPTMEDKAAAMQQMGYGNAAEGGPHEGLPH